MIVDSVFDLRGVSGNAEGYYFCAVVLTGGGTVENCTIVGNRAIHAIEDVALPQCRAHPVVDGRCDGSGGQPAPSQPSARPGMLR